MVSCRCHLRVWKAEKRQGLCRGKTRFRKVGHGCGSTERPPVVDDDELWIGSALGGSRNNSFVGGLDEVAIHRETSVASNYCKRYRRLEQPKPKYVRDDWPIGQGAGRVGRGVFSREGLATSGLAACRQLPARYSWLLPNYPQVREPGVRVDRPKTFLLRALSSVTLPPGEHEWLVRSRWSSRIWVDDKLMVSVPQPAKGGGAHHNVPRIPEDWPAYLRLTGPGDAEKRFRLKSKGKPYRSVSRLLSAT